MRAEPFLSLFGDGELSQRGLTPRYQVHDDNVPSIRLAESIGMNRFLEITHFLYTPGEASR